MATPRPSPKTRPLSSHGKSAYIWNHQFTVLLVMSEQRRDTLLECLGMIRVPVLAIGSCQEARDFLEFKTVAVILTDDTLHDGNWNDLVKFARDRRIRSPVVVAAQQADEHLWSEVLWRGAHDLIVEPYEPDEVARILESAVRAFTL